MSEWQSWKGVDGYYSTKELRHLCSYVKPGMTVVEIGCLHGLSAVWLAQALGPGTLICVDNWLHTENQLETFAANMDRLAPDTLMWRTVTADSKKLEPIPCDLMHIDGDHSYAGVLSDCLLAQASGAIWILLHDYDHPGLEEVRPAIEAFLEMDAYDMVSQVETSVALMRIK